MIRYIVKTRGYRLRKTRPWFPPIPARTFRQPRFHGKAFRARIVPIRTREPFDEAFFDF